MQYLGQGLSVVLDHNFHSNQKIFFSYSSINKNGQLTLFLSSAEIRNNELINSKVIFEANAPRNRPAHFGGKIAFLSDKTILLTSGDGYDAREQAQKLDNHFGKIIRINKDGSVPSDNPFVNKKMLFLRSTPCRNGALW